jgi:hypothetical protein
LNRPFFFIDDYYCDYFHYLTGKCSAWDIGIEGFRWAQGPFHLVQLFGPFTH